MKRIVFTFPGNKKMGGKLIKMLSMEPGKMIIRHFPDEETYLRVESDVASKQAIVICTLVRPDRKLLPLYFLCKTLKKLGAEKVTLIAPYLAYMRQDKRFNPGESVTSEHFAKLISGFADALITTDPHLHRRSNLSEIYSIPSTVIHAADHIALWIKENIKSPVLIGPDEESKQWVSDVAKKAGAPFTVLRKIRYGDRKVKVTVPKVEQFRKTHTPVLVDDIISSGNTMIATMNHLADEKMKPPVCIAVHGVFAGNTYKNLLAAGAKQVVTCNTIEHKTNIIDLTDSICQALQ